LFFVIIFSVTPLKAEKLTLKDLSSHLSTMEKGITTFLQFNDDKTTSTGTISFIKPGRMRIQYDSPNNSLILIAGGRVAIFDSKSNTLPREFPLKQTPLHFFLRKTVNLEQSKFLTSHIMSEDSTVVFLSDPDFGVLKLVFLPNPIRLKEWTISNNFGEDTILRFENFDTSSSLPNTDFNILLELERRNLN
jgi:outer membrane lipoprotein-sorting protein